MNSHHKINRLLLPFSVLYGVVVWFRNKLFDWNIFPGEEFPVPVICVGNITVGGTGKTPHVEYLIELLEKDYKVAVLSRGYRRKTSGFVLADSQATAKTVGDEPLQIFRKFPNTIVAVDGNRRRGIKKLLNISKEKIPEIILLDDAFQHRYVKPFLSILLTDSNRLIYEDVLLPAGRLRESQSGKDRANIVIVTKCSPELNAIDFRLISKHLNLYPCQDLFFTSFKYGDLVPCFESEQSKIKSLAEIKNKHVLLIVGIANPQGLIAELETYTPHLKTIEFPDHHVFSKGDIEKINSQFQQMQGVDKLIVTTEKDFVRLSDCENFTANIKESIYYLPIKVVFKAKEEKLFIKKIHDHVREFKRNSNMA